MADQLDIRQPNLTALSAVRITAGTLILSVLGIAIVEATRIPLIGLTSSLGPRGSGWSTTALLFVLHAAAGFAIARLVGVRTAIWDGVLFLGAVAAAYSLLVWLLTPGSGTGITRYAIGYALILGAYALGAVLRALTRQDQRAPDVHVRGDLWRGSAR